MTRSDRSADRRSAVFRLAHISDLHIGPLPPVTAAAAREQALPRLPGVALAQAAGTPDGSPGGAAPRSSVGGTRSRRDHGRSGQPRAGGRVRAGGCLAAAAGSARVDLGGARQSRCLCADRARAHMGPLGRLHDLRRSRVRSRQSVPLPSPARTARHRRPVERGRDRAGHGDRANSGRRSFRLSIGCSRISPPRAGVGSS